MRRTSTHRDVPSVRRIGTSAASTPPGRVRSRRKTSLIASVVVGIDPREIELPELGRVAAEEVPGGRARVHHAAGVTDHEDRVRCVLHERAEPLLRLALPRLGPFLVALTAGHERDHERGHRGFDHREPVTGRLRDLRLHDAERHRDLAARGSS